MILAAIISVLPLDRRNELGFHRPPRSAGVPLAHEE
jgi:hypothetical protein